MTYNLSKAQQLDQSDPIAHLRQQFVMPADKIYMDGNSLGPLMTNVKARLTETIDQQWGQTLIGSWNEHWIDLPSITGGKIAPLIGAEPEDVICADSVSINLFKLIATALLINPERTTILTLENLFPTDIYMSQGIENLLGKDRCTLHCVDEQNLEDSINEQVNLVLLSEINFRDGKRYDLKRITDLAHKHGAMVLFDLSHSVGVLPIAVQEWHIDFAVGCGYKFLNGGPGAPAFLYVSPAHQNKVQQPLSGWMGHSRPFDFDASYMPAPGIKQYLSGTPNILSLSALDAALDIWQQVEVAAVAEKSTQLTGFFLDLLGDNPALASLDVITPAFRGSQITIRHPVAYSLCQALISLGVICDYRAPGLLRFGFAPLYIRYVDVFEVAMQLEKVLGSKLHQAREFQQLKLVT